MNILERAKAPTPKFFKVLRSIGLALMAISGTILSAPVAIPTAIITTAGYLVMAGGILSAVSQITVDDSAKPLDSVPNYIDNLNKARDGIE